MILLSLVANVGTHRLVYSGDTVLKVTVPGRSEHVNVMCPSLKSNTKALKDAMEEAKKSYEEQEDGEDKAAAVEDLAKGFFVQAHLVGDKYYVALYRGPLSLNLTYQIK